MSQSRLDNLPDTARVWAFASDRELDEQMRSELHLSLTAFLDRWAAHRAALVAGYEIVEDRFLVIAVNEDVARASGCSIDALMRHLDSLESDLGIGLLDSSAVWFRDHEGAVISAPRPDWIRLASSGDVGEQTPVFDLTIADLGSYRRGDLERLAADAWHARLLGQAGQPTADGSTN